VIHNRWSKPAGESLTGKKVCVVGFGDIGKCVVRKLRVFNMNIWVSDPSYVEKQSDYNDIHMDSLEKCLESSHYVISCCPLNDQTFHLLNKENILLCQKGVKLINIGRGPVICEADVITLLENRFIDSVGFDVFEEEPLSHDSQLRKFKQNIFGTHNGSNTTEAVEKVSAMALEKLSFYLNIGTSI